MIHLRTKPFWQASFALGLISFVAFANLYFTQPILPLISEQFSVPPVVASLTVSLSLLTVAIFFFLFSAISDAVGRKNVISIAVILLIITTMLIPLVQNFTLFLILRILQGAFIAGIPTIAIAYIGEEFSPRALGVAIGIYISMNSIGGMGGRVFSGIVSDLYGWRMAFLLMAIVSLFFFIVFLKLLPPSKYFQTKKFERQKAIKDYLTHLKNQKLRLAFFIGGAHFFVFVGIYNYVTYLLTAEPFSLPSIFIGILFLTYLPGTLSSTLAGKTAAAWSQGATIGAGIVLMIIGTLLMIFTKIVLIVTGLLFLSFGFFLSHSSLNAWVSKRASFAKASASGLYLTSYYVGGSLGSFYLGFFWHYWHWPGVIIGTLLIFLLTFFTLIRLMKIDQQPEQVRFFPIANET